MTAQISLQQSTYQSTRNIDQATKVIAESTADIVHKTREIIVSAFGWITVAQILTAPTGSGGP